MNWQDFDCLEEWQLPLVPSSGEGAPTQIVDACGAVGRDLHHRRYGPDVEISAAVWTISLREDGHCHVGLGPGARRSEPNAFPLHSFSFSGTHIDQSLETATVIIADAVQGELAGYPPHIQWPIEEKRLLLPSVRDGQAIWRDPRSDERVAEIGFLGTA